MPLRVSGVTAADSTRLPPRAVPVCSPLGAHAGDTGPDVCLFGGISSALCHGDEFLQEYRSLGGQLGLSCVER